MTNMGCSKCGTTCNLRETLYKIKHKGELYCFCSKECKDAFQKKQFGEVLY